MPPILIAWSALFAATLPVCAQDDPPATPAPTPPADSAQPLGDEPALELSDHIASQFEFTLTPGVWLARLRGDITLGPSPAAPAFSVQNHFDLYDLEPTPNVELDILKRERWNLHFGLFDFSTDQSGVMPVGGAFGPLTLNPGDAYETEFDLTSFDLELSYRRWRPIESDHARLTFLPGAGVRWIGLEHEFTQIGIGSVDEEAEWLALYGSIELNARMDTEEFLPMLEELEVTGRVAAGPVLGAGGGFMGELGVDARAWLTPNLSLLFGFRLLGLSAEDGDYEFEGNLQGLFIGGSLRW